MSTVELLWRHELPTPVRRGRPPRLTVDEVVAAGIAAADEDTGLGLREVAARAGVPVMSLYSYVDGRDQLLELMADTCHARMAHRPLRGGWRARLRRVADDNLALVTEHLWLADLESERAVLGPGTIAKYDRELGAVEALDLTDPDKDAVLSAVLAHVRQSARALARAQLDRALESPQQWWDREGAVLVRLELEDRFPRASRVGSASGAAQQAATDARRAYRFGLELLLDGVAARLQRR